MSNQQHIIKCPTCQSECSMSWAGLELVENSGDETLATRCYSVFNPYKTACEGINPDNPMAVAENLLNVLEEIKHQVAQAKIWLHGEDDEACIRAYGNVNRIQELLTKIQSK